MLGDQEACLASLARLTLLLHFASLLINKPTPICVNGLFEIDQEVPPVMQRPRRNLFEVSRCETAIMYVQLTDTIRSIRFMYLNILLNIITVTIIVRLFLPTDDDSCKRMQIINVLTGKKVVYLEPMCFVLLNLILFSPLLRRTCIRYTLLCIYAYVISSSMAGAAFLRRLRAPCGRCGPPWATRRRP